MNADPMPPHVEVLSPQVVLPFEGAHWYDLADEQHPWMRWRAAEALDVLRRCGVPLERSLRALDVGGGIGTARGQLEAATAWTVDLGELDATALRQSRPGRGRTLHYDVTERRAELAGAYDVIVLFDVLEHIEHTAPFIDALLWHLKAGGHLLINVPALPRAQSRYDEAAGHVRRYTRATLPAELPGDMDVLELRYWGMGLLPALFARKAWLETAGRRLDREAVLRRGFAAPGPIGSGLLRALMAAERRAPGAPAGTSLLLCARHRPGGLPAA